MAEVTTTPIAVAYRDEGFLAAGISASATSITIGGIYKYVSGVKTLQGFDSTSGYAEISYGDRREIISFGASSVNATTKVTTLSDIRRGLPQTNNTANFTAGTGLVWPKGATIRVIDYSNYIHNTVFSDTTQTITGKKTMSGGLVISGTTYPLKLSEYTTTERDNLTPEEGMLIKNSTTGTIQQYSGGTWASVGTDATANGSTTVAGKFEEATQAEQAALTATGATGARLVPAVANLVVAGAGAGDSGKIPILGTDGALAVTVGGTGLTTLTANNLIVGAGASDVTFIAPGANGTVLKSNGTTATFAAPTYYDQTVFCSGTSSANAGASSTSIVTVDTHQYTIPANDLVSGVAYEFEFVGRYVITNTGGTDTLAAYLYLGSVEFSSYQGFVTDTTGEFVLRGMIHGTTTAGAASSVRCGMTGHSGSVAGVSTGNGQDYVAANAATNGTLLMAVKVQFGASDSNNLVQIHTSRIKKISATAF